MPPHHSRSAVSTRSPLSLLRAMRKGLAMLVVTLAFLSSVAYLLPNSSALASSTSGPAVDMAPVPTMAQVPATTTPVSLARDNYSVTSKPKPPPPPPPAVFTIARLVSLVPSSSSASLQWPVSAGTRLASGYGPRDCSGCSTFHEGADFSAPSGTPIWSMAGGIVTVADPGSGPFGVHVVVQHLIDGEVVTTLYAHMLTGSLSVKSGDTVTAGQALGAVGCTGSCTGTHLHFEIHPGGGSAVDPVVWLAARLG